MHCLVALIFTRGPVIRDLIKSSRQRTQTSTLDRKVTSDMTCAKGCRLSFTYLCCTKWGLVLVSVIVTAVELEGDVSS